MVICTEQSVFICIVHLFPTTASWHIATVDPVQRSPLNWVTSAVITVGPMISSATQICNTIQPADEMMTVASKYHAWFVKHKINTDPIQRPTHAGSQHSNCHTMGI